MRFTVAICTWNRAALLSGALERLARAHRPSGGWEVIVVNNNCTDDTEQALDAFAGRLPLRRVFEPRPGLSHARNAAVSHAAGDYMVWTDDDALVDAGWITAYEQAVETYPEAAVFGGPVRPLFEGTPPNWLSAGWQEVSAAYAARDLGERPSELKGDELPYGANYVVRTREQRLFPYDPALGRKQAGGALGEETAVIRAILTAGGIGWWVPGASVEHWVPKERQTVRYLRSYYALQGKTFHKRAAEGGRTFDGHNLLLRGGILRAELSYGVARLGKDPRRWLQHLIRASILRGALNK